MNKPQKKSISGVYIIDSKVEFNYLACTLRSVDKDISFTLLAASSECFHFLLQNQGDLVNKSKLTYEGWEKYGLHVSDNTFYQNVLVIRKGLKACGIDYEVIKTLPRKGLLIPQTIQVKRIVDEFVASPQNDALAETEVDAIDSKNSPFSEACLAGAGVQGEVENRLTTEESSAPQAGCSPVGADAPAQNELLSPDDGNHRKEDTSARAGILLRISGFQLNGRFLCGLTVGSAIFFYAVFCIYLLTSNMDFFEKYTPLKAVSNCHISASTNQQDAIDVNELLSKYNVSCAKDEYIYLTHYDFIKRVSIIQCERPLGHDIKMNKCVSYYVLDSEYEV